MTTSRLYPSTDTFIPQEQSRLTRRDLVAKAALAGMSAGAATFLARGGDPAAAQTPGESGPDGEDGAVLRRAVNTQGRSRGDAGELRILWWHAPSLLNPHLSGDAGTSFVMEPLLAYFPDSSIQPVLLQETPSVENGLLAEDFSTVTLRLLPDLVWSDGMPVTVEDLIFTWQWVVHPDNGATSSLQWDKIASIDAIDEKTATVTFRTPSITWFDTFTGVTTGSLLPAHAFGNDPHNRNDAFQTAPIGTGPYVVEDFRPNDQGTYVINERYRNPDKPFFSRLLLKGGGDAVAAGRSVVYVGDFDFAWNIQASPQVLRDLEGGELGLLYRTTGVNREALHITFADPRTYVDGQYSEKNTPHPILSDRAVRQAMALGIDRGLIAGELYGDASLVPANNLTGDPFFESPNTSREYNLEKATEILEGAGWRLEGAVRRKDGQDLRINVLASTNALRQQTQAIIKQNLEAIGFAVEIPSVDPSIFFDTSPGNTQGFLQGVYDTALYSSEPESKIPTRWMSAWYAGPDGNNVAQKSNRWQGMNIQRWQNAEYDELFEQLLDAHSEEEASELLIALNDLTVEAYAVIPLVLRPFYTAVSRRLELANLAFDHPFVGYFWNLENWTLAEGADPR